MTAVLASIIAVLGTLAGTATAYVFQRRISERSEALAREERLRQEQLLASSAFAGAVMDLRRVQYDRWYRRHENSEQIDPDEVRTESYRLRSVAWSAYYRFSLTCTDAQLTGLAWSAVEQAAHVEKAADEERLRERGDQARAVLEKFVIAAARQFTQTAEPTSQDTPTSKVTQTEQHPMRRPAPEQPAS